MMRLTRLPRRTGRACCLVVRFEFERRMVDIESLAQTHFELLLDCRPAIELIGLLRLGNGAELLLGLSTHPDPEVRVKSVKAAAAMGGPRFLAAFHSRLEDSSWPVRCQAAKGLSRFGSSESIPRLSKALRDQRWWVRFRAAGALATLGTVGKQALAEALTDQNGQVRDMARYLLERGELVPALP